MGLGQSGGRQRSSCSGLVFTQFAAEGPKPTTARSRTRFIHKVRDPPASGADRSSASSAKDPTPRIAHAARCRRRCAAPTSMQRRAALGVQPQSSAVERLAAV